LNALLEGSVRKAGSRVQIAAQLIDAANDLHLWADRFEIAACVPADSA